MKTDLPTAEPNHELPFEDGMPIDLHAERYPAGSLRELLAVGLPLIVSSGSSALMYVADRIFLSWYSVDAMAAALPAGVLHWNLAALAIGTVAYANAFVGQYEGADQHHRVGPVLWQGIYISLIASALILLCVPAAPAVFRWFGHGDNLMGLELSYFNIMCYGTLPLLLNTTLACFYSGRGKTAIIMVVNLIGSLIDVVLDYMLVFGKGGLPEMGIDGAALSSVLGFISMAVMYVVAMVMYDRRGPYHLWTGWRYNRQLFWRLLRYGLPSGTQQFLDIACFTVFIQLIGSMGTEQLSATSLVFNLNSFTFIPLLGLGTAVTALVGRRIGEGRPQLAVRTTWWGVAVAQLYVVLFAWIYFFTPGWILQPYGLSQHENLSELVMFLLKFVAIYSFFDAMVVVFGSAIRGAGDTTFSLVFSFALGVVLLVLPTYVASFWPAQAFEAAWYAVTIFIIVLGFGFGVRFQQGKWKSMRVIEHTLPELEGVSGS
jgi:multidrug resistance protein, MATE family